MSKKVSILFKSRVDYRRVYNKLRKDKSFGSYIVNRAARKIEFDFENESKATLLTALLKSYLGEYYYQLIIESDGGDISTDIVPITNNEEEE